jgi:hypothetical protein
MQLILALNMANVNDLTWTLDVIESPEYCSSAWRCTPCAGSYVHLNESASPSAWWRRGMSLQRIARDRRSIPQLLAQAVQHSVG